jgi:hypothetical protein
MLTPRFKKLSNILDLEEQQQSRELNLLFLTWKEKQWSGEEVVATQPQLSLGS